jgi:hypothetical protein
MVGVMGQAASEKSIGVAGFGSGSGGIGVWGSAPVEVNSFAGYFYGDVVIHGTLTQIQSNIRIDHPLDPANKYLVHSCIQSPEETFLYSGLTTTDDQAQAVIVLPDYFEALSGAVYYQLTVVGQFAQAIVARELSNNQASQALKCRGR